MGRSANKTPRPSVDDRRRELARLVRGWSVEDFYAQVVAAGAERMYLVYENGEITLSHPQLLAPLRAFIELSQDFSQHEGLFIARRPGIPTLFFAFVHDTRRGLAQGGLRFKRYPNLAELLTDGLRLSQGMTRKNALAGLAWGGGKGILPVTDEIDRPDYTRTPATDDDMTPERRGLFGAYGRFIAGLGGVYYTAEDMGTKTPDMDVVLSQNRFTTCISSGVGGSGNPSPFTARGVFRGMQAAWQFLTGSSSLRGVRVAVQGAGNVGNPLIGLLDEADADVWVSDVSNESLAKVAAERPRVHVVSPDSIYDLDVDVFAPCGPGATVNSATIPRLRARLVCGAANNILKEVPADAQRLQDRGIAFVPDFVCNRMGITNCADEWYGYLQEDIQLAAENVYPDSLRVLKHARNLVITTTKAANQLADIAASEPHPMLGHRGRRIIDHLLASRWAHGTEAPIVGREEASRTIPDLPFQPLLHEETIRIGWEREGFRGTGLQIAAAPIPTAGRPSLASVFPAVLMDVQARALERSREGRPRRILGSDHGGHALQFAVERASPHAREEIGRPYFEQLCRDVHGTHDAMIREQLLQLGVGFDPDRWLDPMREEGRSVCQHLYASLVEAGVVAEEQRLTFHCPRCATVLMASEVERSHVDADTRYRLRFVTDGGREIEVAAFQPELVVGAVAIAVRPDGAFGDCAGAFVHPVVAPGSLPVVADPSAVSDAELIVPAFSPADLQWAREHGIGKHPAVFDESGQVALADGSRVALDVARATVLGQFGPQATVERGKWRVAIQRCARCGSIVHPSFSADLYVRLEDGMFALRSAIASGEVEFSHPAWRDRVLEHLEHLEPWCISRQLWWGIPIPGRAATGSVAGAEVFSTWFSLVAWALQGAGWPGATNPEPIDRVFVDPDLLVRWIVPSQLVSLIVAGRPAFRRVDVYGSIHVAERKLVLRDGAAGDDPDEERFLYRSIRRPMRRRLGNVVEPRALVRRFGADALRLGYLLCATDSHEVILLAETQLRYARSVLHGFVAKVAGIAKLLRSSPPDDAPRLADHWIVSKATIGAESASAAYAAGRLTDAAHLLVDTLGAYTRYVNVVVGRRAEAKLGAIRAASLEFLELVAGAFAPICPFMFERLNHWREALRPASNAGIAIEPWLVALVEDLHTESTRAEVGTPNEGLLERLRADADELARLGKGRVTVATALGAGRARIIEEVVVVRPGDLSVSGTGGGARTWYMERHGKDTGG